MPRAIIFIAAILLVLHGLIHLMGTAVYLKLGRIEELNYKTTVLGGRWDLGEGGIAAFGALWAVAAIGFVAAAVALLACKRHLTTSVASDILAASFHANGSTKGRDVPCVCWS